MKSKKLQRRLALFVAIAIVLSLFVAVTLILAMSGCQKADAQHLSALPASPAPGDDQEPAAADLINLGESQIQWVALTDAVCPGVASMAASAKSPSPAKKIKAKCHLVNPLISNPGRIAFTFDDGPGRHTERLLDALKSFNVRVTFFVQGRAAERYPHLIQRMQEEGHQVANHTYSHVFLTKADPLIREQQLLETSDIIENLTGSRPTIMRPPGGHRGEEVYAEAGRQGMATVLWDIDTADWVYKDAGYVYDFLLRRARAGKIFLMHDIHPTTVDGFIQALPLLLDHGFVPVTVDELIQLQPGDVYPAFWRR